MRAQLSLAINLALVLAGTAGLSGCNHAGPRGLRTGRVLYNEAVSLTNNEQILLNLVRLRYRDNPQFLEVTSISTQYQLTGSSGLSGSGSPDSGVDDLSASFGISYTEKPTISLAPLQGEQFVTQLLSPIDLQTTALLLHSGWRIDRVLRCLVQGLNGIDNASTASSPTPETPPTFAGFHRLASALRDLQRQQRIELAVGGSDGRLILQIAEDAVETPATNEVTRLLGLEPGRDRYEMVPGVIGTPSDKIVVNMRSLMGVLFFLSQGVIVPPAHEQQGLVTVTLTESGERFDWAQVSGDLLQVRWSKQRPDSAAVSIRYRGVWFYIADNDLMSKSTFAMLGQLIALQSGGTPTASPVLTLPLG